ncbi:MAG TPA: hypothetical protein VF682_02980 [Pseudomonas sp.]|jgi:hypothetical protein
MNTQLTNALEAPVVPVAQQDGLIHISDLNNDIAIHFPVWSGAVEGIDTNQLIINGLLVEEPSIIPEGATELTLYIPVATHLQDDGIYSVGYRATNVVGGVSADSKSTQIRIDRTAPGAALLAGVLFANVSFGDNLVGRIPGYAGMEVGNMIQTLCNDMIGPACLVTTDNLTNTPITITFPREFLQSLDSDTVTITYQVTDRAGNRSILAEPVELTMQR